MIRLLTIYNSFLQRRPLLAQCFTTAGLSGTGDVLAQQLIEGKGWNHDALRTSRQALWGGVFFAPLVCRWFAFLQRIPINNPRTAVLARATLDQTIFAPVTAGGFFAVLAALEGNTSPQIKARMQEGFVPTLIQGYYVFVPAQLVNFGLVPPTHRFAFIGGVCLLWDTYLSYVNERLRHQTSLDVRIPSSRIMEQIAQRSRAQLEIHE